MFIHITIAGSQGKKLSIENYHILKKKKKVNSFKRGEEKLSLHKL